jgi:glycerol-3-phosphate dehydrogenase (NAD(P)+)
VEKKMKISILGCGNWGSVFGILQNRNGHQVRLWEYDRPRCQKIQRTRDNSPFLTGYALPSEIAVDWDIATVVKGAELVVFAVPSQSLTSVGRALANIDVDCPLYLNLTKGIDTTTLKRPSEIIEEHVARDSAVFSLSGPCIANEIVRGAPTAAVIVGNDEKNSSLLQQALVTDTFRIYQGHDMIGVELGGAFKNVIALGCGISDGLGYGTNAKGALITRGIVEIQRLGVCMGAHAETFWGLSGLGDLVTTSFSGESRNYRFGRLLGQGKSLKHIQQEIVMVAEGIPTARAIRELKSRYGIEMPICDVVYDIIYEAKSPQRAMKELMSRPLKNE